MTVSNCPKHCPGELERGAIGRPGDRPTSVGRRTSPPASVCRFRSARAHWELACDPQPAARAELLLLHVAPLLLTTNGIRDDVIGEHNLTVQRPAVFLYNHRNQVDPFVAGNWFGTTDRDRQEGTSARSHLRHAAQAE